MLIETQVIRSKSDFLKELEKNTVAKAIVYRNPDRRGWEQIAREHQETRAVTLIVVQG
ncbi:hypothetical protein [Aestuariivirga sp.]|uniref:hypothetical protein n=1 Tax=Aestuariivirga sp. TaxID=2650926 RepID=UPI003019B3D0